MMVVDIMSGAIVAMAFTAVLFFIRFWRQTHDRLFLTFAVAFSMLGGERLILIVMNTKDETHNYVYLIRLIAFVAIIIGIIDKNRIRSSSRG